MNYIGSKLKLSSCIKTEIKKIVGDDLSSKVFCDLFAGTGIIGRSFKKEVKQVISNDLEYFSYVLNRHYIKNHRDIRNKGDFIKELNALPLTDNGFIYQNYCMGSGSQRQYFSDANGKKIDTIRGRLKQWHKGKKISQNLYFFLLTSLLESADKIANTASVYAAFLKKIKKSADRELILKPAEFIINDNHHKVFNMDSNQLIRKISGDILYLDPPYNHRQYGAYYHMLNTIAKYDDFVPQGKTGLRNYSRSSYCQKRIVSKCFDDLIRNAQFEYIFLSYNNEGLMDVGEIRKIMAKYGKYSLVMKGYQRFKADKTDNRHHKADKTIEYLHILHK